MLTGGLIATYSIWDKVGVSHVTPFLYMYLMSAGTAIGTAPYLLRTHGRSALRLEWQGNAVSIVGVALLTFVAYGLVLTAFQFSRVSYIAPAREVGIVVGVLLGILVLKEPFGRGRLFGSGLIALGFSLVYHKFWLPDTKRLLTHLPKLKFRLTHNRRQARGNSRKAKRNNS